MDSEKVIELFDSCWFQMQIFKPQPRSSISEPNPAGQNEEKPSKPEILRIPTIHRRSMSAQLSSDTCFDSVSLSPDSVLSPPKLQTVFSEKEIAKEEEEEENQTKPAHIEEYVPKKEVAKVRRSRKKINESKSLSELEFEELKGFMDLGFVFTEEDNRDSRLVEIVPGLQRLGKKDETIESDIDKSAIPRPYLSEAWGVMERRKKKDPVLMNWKIPSLSNEIDMKDNLRCWAHTVALSAVR